MCYIAIWSCYLPLLATFASCLSVATTKTRPRRSVRHQLDRFLTRLQNPQQLPQNYTYLQGNYAPVADEHLNLPVAVEEGAIPLDLNGKLFRNGPNPTPLLSKKYHWFDGHAMLHMLRFEDGNARYSNQFVPAPRYLIENELGEDFFPNMGEWKGFIGLIKVVFFGYALAGEKCPEPSLTSGPPNTACLMYRNKLYCLNEGALPFEVRVRPDGSLQPVGYERFDGVLNYPVSAHPRIDENGDLLFHSYSANTLEIERDGPIKVGRFSLANGKVESYFVPTAEKYCSFSHSLLHTEKYMIIFDGSVHFDVNAMLDGGAFFRTKLEYNLRIGILPKTASQIEDVVWIDTGKPGGVVHPLNSWEDHDESIVIWTPVCDNLALDLDSDEINVFRMVEFRLDPVAGTVLSEHVIANSPNIEFSVVPQMGRFTRFGYTAIQDPSTPGEGSFAGFCVWDMAEGKLYKTVYYENGEVGGEPMLLKSPNKVYVGVYQQRGDHDSFFCIYDGMSTDLVARLQMPSRVPFGFHGLWVSDEELQGHFDYHERSNL